MSKQLLQEYFELCPEGRCPIHVLSEAEKRDVMEGAVYLVGIIQKAGTKNGNGRVYRKETLNREIKNYQKSINERRSLGELDHPDDSVINLKNASHLVTKTWWEGNSVMGKIEVLDTPSGKILKDLVKANVKLGISSRGLGSVKPSTPGAYLDKSINSTAQVDSKINLYINENKNNKIDELFSSILRD